MGQRGGTVEYGWEGVICERGSKEVTMRWCPVGSVPEVVRSCFLANWGSESRAFHDLHADLNRRRDFAGILASISVVRSMGMVSGVTMSGWLLEEEGVNCSDLPGVVSSVSGRDEEPLLPAAITVCAAHCAVS